MGANTTNWGDRPNPFLEAFRMWLSMSANSGECGFRVDVAGGGSLGTCTVVVDRGRRVVVDVVLVVVDVVVVVVLAVVRRFVVLGGVLRVLGAALEAGKLRVVVVTLSRPLASLSPSTKWTTYTGLSPSVPTVVASTIAPGLGCAGNTGSELDA